MATPPRKRWRKIPSKRLVRAGVLTRFARAYELAAEAGKLRPSKKEKQARIKKALEWITRRYPTKLPELHHQLDTQLHRLSDQLWRLTWITSRNDDPVNAAERERMSRAKGGIVDFLYSTNSLQAKLYAFARLRMILQASKILLQRHDIERQRIMIQQVERLQKELQQGGWGA
ncbi:MAG: hypothetical protein IPJ89_04420 [Candidatus Iainarchaeum archaeon]|uniref:Uncharacterized protein n=1 Tax=Candidatus Iainarchaeum sp. TaxID=3101447 RepID=A0A7T9DJA5_9ARCH|nr:MAG: hypothetical protein IPJ89_04420 [Candidatus Diapherotrites archaeon]